MLDKTLNNKLHKVLTSKTQKYIALCPYCKNYVSEGDGDVEYIKTKQSIEHFFHKSCFYREVMKEGGLKLK